MEKREKSTNQIESVSNNWFVLRTRPRQEYRAKQNLENQAARTYLPMLSCERIKRNKRVIVEELLFPGYIFVQFSTDRALFHKIRSTFGVINFVKFGQHLAQITDAGMQSMYNSVEKLTIKNRSIQHSAPSVGDTVEITQGPFSGLHATIVELKGNERCLVMLEMLHKQVRADLDYSQVRM
tara:strand:+ start:731 stop:1273 length:543 start_codon:yes stop_codon:yes gene_type:complete